MAIRDDFAPGEVLTSADLNDTFASKPPYEYSDTEPTTNLVGGFLWFDTNDSPPTPYYYDADEAEFVPFPSGVGAADFSNAATGTYTDDGIAYKYLTFTASGTLTVTQEGFADVLVIGGGGKGGGGGGGAGGYLEITDAYLPAETLTVTVGGGGTTRIGNASRLGSFFAVGGGNGSTGANGNTGGSGGGGGGSNDVGFSGTSGQGNSGGTGGAFSGAGGGGGAGAAGSNAASSQAGGAGGAGTASGITDPTSPVTRGGGGGGSGFGGNPQGAGGAGGGGTGNDTIAGDAGTVNTGGGGGGSRTSTGGNGGSGVVIVRVKV